RMKDVDVFSKLLSLPPAVGPRDLLKTFSKILIRGFTPDRVKPQDRSFKVNFPDFDLEVDVVPARPWSRHWQIPDRTEHGGEWQETNPERLSDLTTEMNEAHGDFYIPIVKLVRQTRRAHLGKRPGGLFFEVLTYHAFASGSASGSNVAEYYCSTLNGVVTQLSLAITTGLADPSLPGRLVSTRASTEDFRVALETFRSLAAAANRALRDGDRCRAAKTFQDVLGRNGDGGIVFSLPGDCDESGMKRSAPAIVAGDRHVPAG